ncbi:hypothetical protein [Alkalibacillus haloalkaliphilus]|uniref:hypothetical protein n=1 Tax=Alkalibacillus haloalkaliphilus TaxID=94136 RepID=UPI002935D906|nr:hypothetical protein [Alkalibacillus haloalkaliphilus]MDV2580803.1 hypothetical protein [Alkalibacillus haloalkaliphilus]
MSLKQFFSNKIVLLVVTVLAISMMIAVVLFSYFYFEIQGTHNEEQRTYSNIAVDHSPIETIEDDFYYNGEQTYTVVQGVGDGERYFTFVPKKDNLEEDDISWVLESEGVSKDDILSEWQQDCSNCNLLHITPGIMNERTIWEVVFEDDDRMYFRTYLFETGELYDSISFSKN